MQSQIGHHRRHHGVVGQLACTAQRHTAYRHDLIAVNGMSSFIHQQASVGIAVKGNAQLVLSCHRHNRQLLQMGGAAAVIDINAIRVNVDKIRHHRQTLE